MTPRRSVLAGVLCFAFPWTAAEGDTWQRPGEEEYTAESGAYVLKVVPHDPPLAKPGHCRATLFRVEGKKKREVWSRHLINNWAPVRAFVADSGKYVVTMDEWHQVGTLPVVIYGGRGELVKVHSTESLGLQDDIEHIQVSVSSCWWNEGAVGFFGPGDESFCIRLHWGKWIFLSLRLGDLQDGTVDVGRKDLLEKLLKKKESLRAFAQRRLEDRVLALLDAEDPLDRQTGAVVAGQEKFRKAIPRLRQLLGDETTVTKYTGASLLWMKGTKVYYVRKAAKEALEAMDEKVEGVVTEKPDRR